MGRFLFSTAPLPGHLDWGGMLLTAKYLHSQGHEVLWASGSDILPLVAEVGLNTYSVPYAFRPPPHAWTPLDKPAEWYAFQVEQTINIWCHQADILAAVESHVQLIETWQPDIIITEPMVYAAALAAEVTQTRLACCGFPGPYMVIEDFGASQAVIEHWNTLRNQLRTTLGLAPFEADAEPELFFQSKDLHLVYFPPHWFKHVAKRIAPSVRYVGGQLPQSIQSPPDFLQQFPADRPIVMITQSTGFGYGGAILPDLIRALEQFEVSLIITGQTAHRVPFEPLPAWIQWLDWVDYDHVLPYINVLIHHGGMGTTHTAICHGLPQIVTPVAADQYIHAERVMAYGAGIMLQPHELQLENIVQTIRSILLSDRYLAAAQKLQAHFARFGGVKQAAELLVNAVLQPEDMAHVFINNA